MSRTGRLPFPRSRDHAGLALALLVCAALAFPACGRKTPVRPPELAAPKRITSLTAANTDTGIRLAWKRPRQYADGTRMVDLGGFRIDRSSGGGPFADLATLAVTDRDRLRQAQRFRFDDTTAREGELYRYRVVAFTVDDYVSKPSNVVEVVRATPTPAPSTTGDRSPASGE